ncbi:unnamed protein product, partial [Oikopleura dioica]
PMLDWIPAAMLPAATPPAVKPTAPRATGAAIIPPVTAAVAFAALSRYQFSKNFIFL